MHLGYKVLEDLQEDVDLGELLVLWENLESQEMMERMENRAFKDCQGHQVHQETREIRDQEGSRVQKVLLVFLEQLVPEEILGKMECLVELV